MVVVVLHEHDWAIDDAVRSYEERLSLAKLDNISFHGKDLLHGNEDYESVSIGDRKRLLTQFARLARMLPYRYFVLRYNRDDVHGQYELEAKLRRDLASVVFERLSFFQQFDSVSVYYDGGQKTVSIALSYLRETLPTSERQTIPQGAFFRLRIIFVRSNVPWKDLTKAHNRIRRYDFSAAAASCTSRI